MNILTIGISSYNNDPFIYNLFYELEEQVKRSPEILDYVSFILYDDKSTNTKTLDKVPSFFKVIIATENFGTPAKGRNEIIKNSNSKYLMFIDGDDIIIRNIVDIVIELKKRNEDIIFSNVVKIDGNGNHLKSPFIYSDLLKDSKVEEKMLKKICAHQTGIWSIYKLKFINRNNVFYETDMRYEDNFFLYNLLINKPKIGVISESYYGWRINYKSFSYSNKTINERIHLYKRTLELLKAHEDNEYSAYILFSVWNQTYTNILRNYPTLNYKETYVYFKKLNAVSKEHETQIKNLKKNIDPNFTDKYFLITNYKFFQNFAFIYYLKSSRCLIKKLRKQKKQILKLFCFLPIQTNKVWMTSHYGDFGSNPKYLYKQLKDKKSPLKIRYMTKDKELINGKEILNYKNKFLFYYNFYTAKYVYFDTWMNPDLVKRKNQIWIQMWHGYPYKKVFTDINIYDKVNSQLQHELKQGNIDQWDKVYSLNSANTKIFKDLFPKAQIVEREYERIEWLIKNKDNEQLKREIKLKYNLNEQDSYTLYAPTYRPYKVYFDIDQIQKIIKPNNKLLYNAHPLLKTQFIFNGIILKNVDIQEILLITDQLITDYSSIQYDFLKIKDSSCVAYYKPDEFLYDNYHGLYNEENYIRILSNERSV